MNSEGYNLALNKAGLSFTIQQTGHATNCDVLTNQLYLCKGIILRTELIKYQNELYMCVRYVPAAAEAAALWNKCRSSLWHAAQAQVSAAAFMVHCGLHRGSCQVCKCMLSLTQTPYTPLWGIAAQGKFQELHWGCAVATLDQQDNSVEGGTMTRVATLAIM